MTLSPSPAPPCPSGASPCRLVCLRDPPPRSRMGQRQPLPDGPQARGGPGRADADRVAHPVSGGPARAEPRPGGRPNLPERPLPVPPLPRPGRLQAGPRLDPQRCRHEHRGSPAPAGARQLQAVGEARGLVGRWGRRDPKAPQVRRGPGRHHHGLPSQDPLQHSRHNDCKASRARGVPGAPVLSNPKPSRAELGRVIIVRVEAIVVVPRCTCAT